MPRQAKTLACGGTTTAQAGTKAVLQPVEALCVVLVNWFAQCARRKEGKDATRKNREEHKNARGSNTQLPRPLPS